MKEMPDKSDPERGDHLPDDAELLAYLDGELSSARMSEVKQLVAQSAEVQSRLEAVEQDLVLFNDAMSDALAPAFPPASVMLHAMNKRLPAEGNKRKMLPVIVFPGCVRNNILPPRPWLRIAACLLAGVGLSSWFLARQSVGRVSAAEIINRSAAAEQTRMRGIVAPVVHQRLTVRRQTANSTPIQATWELWNQVGANRFREQTRRDQASTDANSVVNELQLVYTHNRVDRTRPLSPAAFADWRAANTVSESVKPARTQRGEEAFSITATPEGTAAADRIIEADFVVRSSDWHPVQQHLKVLGSDGIREYDLTEDTYEIVTLNSVAASVFEELPPVLDSHYANRVAPQLPAEQALPLHLAEPSLAAQDSRADLIASAIEVEYALHQEKACTAITVRSDADGQLLVQGVARSEQRKQEIISALSAVHSSALLKIDIRAMNESQEPMSSVSAASTGQVTQASPVGRISDAASVADQALLEATALYLMTEVSPLSDDVAIPTVSHEHLEAMVRDHLTEIAASLTDIRNLSASVVTNNDGKGENLSDDSIRTRKWPEAAVFLFRDVRSLDSLLNGLPEVRDARASGSESILPIFQRLLLQTADPTSTVNSWFTRTANGAAYR